MKTQILQLEGHDDINSTRDKLGWGQTGRVILVWPMRSSGADRSKVLNQRLDLVMLQRHSASLGLQIALVTHDPEVRFHASQLHIPIFNSTDEAQRARWRRRRGFVYGSGWYSPGWGSSYATGQDERQKRNQRIQLIQPRLYAQRTIHVAPKVLHPVLRWGLFGLAILSLLGLGASILPTAKITLEPETHPQEIAFNILANTSHKEANLSGDVPAQITTVIVEGRSSLPATGIIQAPEKAASAWVRFTNLTDKPVEIPQGLVLSTLPKEGQTAVRFLTTEAGRLPAGAGKYISLPMRAFAPGRSGNLPAGSLVTIEDPLGLSLSATNLLPTSGGTNLPVSAPTQDDYTRLFDELAATLRQEALSDLHTSTAPGDLVITPTLNLVETLEKNYDPPQPGPADFSSSSTDLTSSIPSTQLRLFLRLKFQAMIVPGADLRGIGTRLLDASLPDGVTPIPDSMKITPSGLPYIDLPTEEREQDPSNASIRWRVVARRLVQASIQSDQVTSLTRGLAGSQTEQFLTAWLPLNQPAIVAITPGWWPRLPLLSTRIKVEIVGGMRTPP